MIYNLGVLATYDAATHTWTTVPHIPPVSPAQQPDQPVVTPGPMTRSGHTLVYDPINKRVLMFGGTSVLAPGWRNNGDVLAYDQTTSTWTTIVPATILSATP
ncbi:MAG: hypothetical protein ABI474_03370 [Actinomycetota bacterium]